MTKKDYVAIAKVFKGVWSGPIATRNTAVRLVLHGTALHLSRVFAEGSSRFDKDRFLRACGVEK